MEKDDLKYEEYYVAYMDILGFKEIVDDSNISCSEVYSILNDSRKKILQDISQNNEIVLKTSDIGIYVMSDSIVYYIKASTKNALMILISNCCALMGMLSVRDKIVLIRGAITKGKLISRDNIIFGPALTSAYLLEKECAIYPRIIIDGALKTELYNYISDLHAPNEKDTLIKLLAQISYIDEDEWLCVKNTIYFIDKFKDHLDRFIVELNERMNKTHDKKIREKYLYIIKLSKTFKGSQTGHYITK